MEPSMQIAFWKEEKNNLKWKSKNIVKAYINAYRAGLEVTSIHYTSSAKYNKK